MHVGGLYLAPASFSLVLNIFLYFANVTYSMNLATLKRSIIDCGAITSVDHTVSLAMPDEKSGSCFTASNLSIMFFINATYLNTFTELLGWNYCTEMCPFFPQQFMNLWTLCCLLELLKGGKLDR